MRSTTLAFALTLCALATHSAAQQAPVRDEFFWLGEMNKATAVINTEEGLLERTMTPLVTAGITKVLKDGSQPGARRPSSVITFEPLLIQAAGAEITLLHAGRSSQDMHATYRAAILRDDMLNLADQLNRTAGSLVRLAEKHADTVVPNYTNGVAAQPNSSGTICSATPQGWSATPSASVKRPCASTVRRWARPF